MKLIVGLGNPGSEYTLTRHNVGFIVAEELAYRWGVTGWRSKFDACVAEVSEKKAVLAKPQTYMNNSGVAVGAIVRWHKLSAADIVVISDDLDLPPGGLRIRTKGGSGGHRGIESILVHLGQEDFVRVRIGIGRPPQGWDTPDFVLGRFSKEEAPLMTEACKRAADAVECILAKGTTAAMNEFNR